MSNEVPLATAIPSGDPPRYTFTFGEHQAQSTWPAARSVHWDELVGLMTHHQIGEKTGPCIVPARLSGSVRNKQYAQQIDVVFLDSDVGHILPEMEAAIAAKGWRAIISSTHSHMTTQSSTKRGAWDRFLAAHGEGVTLPGLMEPFPVEWERQGTVHKSPGPVSSAV